MSTSRPWTLQCVFDWLEVREKEGRGFPSSVSDLIREVDHSALLRRLMEGKEPLPHPPPLSFAYPWYELVDNGSAVPSEVSLIHLPDGTVGGRDQILINQHPWLVVKANHIEESYVVRFGNSTELYKLWLTDSVNRAWKIEKIDSMRNVTIPLS